MEPAQLEQPQVMDRASAFLRQQFRLIPAEVGPYIQSPRHRGISATVLEPQEMGMPQAEVAQRAEQAALDVGMFPTNEEENSDAEWSLEGCVKLDYGSDEDRCRDYLRAMKLAIRKGHDVALQALTWRREWYLVRTYIRETCPQRFRSCFEDRGWPAVET